MAFNTIIHDLRTLEIQELFINHPSLKFCRVEWDCFYNKLIADNTYTKLEAIERCGGKIGKDLKFRYKLNDASEFDMGTYFLQQKIETFDYIFENGIKNRWVVTDYGYFNLDRFEVEKESGNVYLYLSLQMEFSEDVNFSSFDELTGVKAYNNRGELVEEINYGVPYPLDFTSIDNDKYTLYYDCVFDVLSNGGDADTRILDLYKKVKELDEEFEDVVFIVDGKFAFRHYDFPWRTDYRKRGGAGGGYSLEKYLTGFTRFPIRGTFDFR